VPPGEVVEGDITTIPLAWNSSSTKLQDGLLALPSDSSTGMDISNPRRKFAGPEVPTPFKAGCVIQSGAWSGCANFSSVDAGSGRVVVCNAHRGFLPGTVRRKSPVHRCG